MNPNLTELDFMHECYIRGLYQNDAQMNWKYKYLRRGYQGEKIMYDWLLENLPPQAVILHDTWMQYRGTTQIDFLVLLKNILWVIEVKHYNGYFQYKDNICTLNNKRTDKDYIAQMRNRMYIMNDIITQCNQDFQLKGAMIFTHPNSEIGIPEESTFATLTLNQLYRYYHTEIQPDLHRIPQNLLTHLNKFQISSTFPMPTLEESDIPFLKKGVYCPECFSFNLRTSDRNIFCEECQYKELKRKSIIRQYCSLGVLQHQQTHLTNTAIYKLSNNCISINYIRRLLKDKINYVNQGKQVLFVNHALPYNKLANKIDLY